MGSTRGRLSRRRPPVPTMPARGLRPTQASQPYAGNLRARSHAPRLQTPRHEVIMSRQRPTPKAHLSVYSGIL